MRARAPWFGKPSDGHMFWLTAHAWKVLENWWEEGAIASRFLLLDNPPSIEHRTLADRSPYISYPPGAFVPLHLLARAAGIRPTPALIMGWNLANHLAIAALLATLGFAAARAAGVEPATAAAFGAAPAAVVLLTPGPMYWLQNVYWADQAVILPFVLAIALEWVRGEAGPIGGLARRLSPAVLFWGCLVDYLFVFVTAAVFLARWWRGELGAGTRARRLAALRFLAAPAAALAIFVLHLKAGDGLGRIVGRARWRMVGRAGSAREVPESPLLFWVDHARAQYGDSGVALLALGAAALAVLVAVAVRRARRGAGGRRPVAARLLGAGALALLPAAAQILVLRSHSVIHDFSVLKLAIPLALLPFVVAPIGWLALAPGPPSPRRARATAAVVIAVATAYLGAVHPSFAAQFPRPRVRHAEAAWLLRREAGYADVVFSPQLEVAPFPPQLLAIARERVYPVRRPARLAGEVRRRTRTLEERFRVCLVFTGAVPAEWRPLVRGLRPEREGAARLFCGVRGAWSRQPRPSPR